MTALTLRLTKGSPLTYAEADANFSGLADLSLTTFLQSGTGAVERTVQSKERDIVSVKDDGATGDGVSNDGASFTNIFADFQTALIEIPFATYLVPALTLPQAGKLSGRGSTLKPSANSMTVLSLAPGLTFQSGDFQLVRDLIVDGTGKTGITGVKAVTGTNAASRLENVTALNCDIISFDLQNSQFCRTQGLRASGGTGAGLLIKNVAVDGGGNSHDHYGLHVAGKEVGVLVNGTLFAGGVHSINFYNPQILGNTVCGMAFFDANATIYGGAPESNASGAATVVVDGKTVKKSSMYLNNSTVRADNLQIAESSCNPCFLLETNSKLTLKDATGYGLSSGTLVSADASSTVTLEGSYGCIGIVQNVSSWPDAFHVQTAQQVLYGTPVLSIDSSVSMLYSDKAPILVAGGTTPPTGTYVEDSNMGYCRQIAFTANAGSVSANLATVTLGSAAGSKDSVLSVLIVAGSDCTLGFNLYDGAAYDAINSQGGVSLKAGVVTRLLIARSGIAAGTWQWIFFPVDASGPTIKFSNLIVYQGTPNTAVNTEAVSKIVKYGLWHPGVTRETQTNLRLLAATVNAVNGGKYPGKQVWDTTNNRFVVAAGNAAADVWKDGVNTTVHTPV